MQHRALGAATTQVPPLAEPYPVRLVEAFNIDNAPEPGRGRPDEKNMLQDCIYYLLEMCSNYFVVELSRYQKES